MEKNKEQEITIKKDLLIELVNIVNECCSLMDDDYIAEWLTTPNSFFNMETPMSELHNGGMEKILRLLYFIEIGEADLT